MLKTLLLIPPAYGYNFPPLGTPALCAYLKVNGFSSEQRDLNIGYRDFLLDSLEVPGLNPALKKELLPLALNQFFEDIPGSRYYSACLPRKKSYAFLPYLPYGDAGNSSFYFTENLLSSRHLFRYLDDADENTFLRYYLDSGIAKTVKDGAFGLLGISVTSPSQAIAALTLCRLLKKEAPRAHLCLGGQWVTLFRKELLRRRDLCSVFDSFIPFEGERPLLRLAQQLSNGARVSTIDGVITHESPVSSLEKQDCPPMGELPCPDFSGLPLEIYDAAEKTGHTLTYETSRGCYWNKCAYCVDLPLPKPSYRGKPAALAAQDMAELKKKHRAVYLMCGDPGMSPAQMRALSREILKRRIKIGWWTMARLDAGFSRPLFRLAYKAGLRQINFGFESASDAVCARLHKGNTSAVSERVLRDCAAAGIRVDLQTMMGLPGETAEQAMQTVEFLIRNASSIYDVTFNIYYLTPANNVFLHPGRYGIKFDKPRNRPFQFFHPFRNLAGISPQQAARVVGIYRTLLAKDKAAPAPRHISDRTRSLPWPKKDSLLTASFRFGRRSHPFFLFLERKNNTCTTLSTKAGRRLKAALRAGPLSANGRKKLLGE